MLTWDQLQRLGIHYDGHRIIVFCVRCRLSFGSYYRLTTADLEVGAGGHVCDDLKR